MTPPPESGRSSLWGEQFPQLLAAAKAGADWAWADLYDALAPVILGYVRGRGAPDPEDLLGETFLHAFRNVRGFEGDERAFRTWLLGIAHRRLVDDVRYRARRPAVAASADELDDLGGRAPDAAEAALGNVELARILHAVNKLSPDQQDVLVLRFIADLSLEEVARVTGKKVSAVKALQRRGLASLLREFSRQGVSL